MRFSRDLASTEAVKALAAYPLAVDGQVRRVTWLEPSPDGMDESSLSVQLRAGVPAQVDGVNHYHLSGKLKKQTVKGWGFPFYSFVAESGVASTRIKGLAVEAREEIVWAEPELVRYNSRLPLVVYISVHMTLTCRVLKPTSEYLLISTG